MQSWFSVETQLIAVATAAVMLVAVLVSTWRVWRRRHAQAKLRQTLFRLGIDGLQDALLPDGMGGWLHIDFRLDL